MRSLCSPKLAELSCFLSLSSFSTLAQTCRALFASTDNVAADAFARCLPARCDRQSKSRHDPG